MTRVPVLTEAVLRAWGLDDPRVLPMLRHENQPGAGRRAQAVRERAEGAGWPSLHVGISATRAAVSESVRELEDTDWRWTERASRAWLWETPAFPSALICGDE